MSDERLAALEKHVDALDVGFHALKKGLDIVAPGLVELRRDEHEGHRLMFALAVAFIRSSPEPLRAALAIREVAFAGMGDEATPETQKRMETVLASLEQVAIAAGRSR